MAAIFRNILIPVDFSINTEVAVKKCLEIIEPEKSVIHLFHVEKKLPNWPVSAGRFFRQFAKNPPDHTSVTKNFNEWKTFIKKTAPFIEVTTESKKAANIEKAVIRKASQSNPDIVIVGKNSHHTTFPFLNTISPGRIAKETGFPVLMVKPGSLESKVKSIVMPVGLSVPKRKIELLVALRKKFRISIHLVTFLQKNPGTNEYAAFALLDTYKSLQELAHCPLGHEVLRGDNIAKSTLKYAQQIKADMLLVDPEKETKLTSFSGKHISDVLLPDSRLQILTVQS
jgi:hypothetical protein